ncbi:RHS repeat-associated core domain-containing protein, partial [Yersinia rochesterensis]|uniref:RHS repeat-associated core domain-containing protein n=1 Tax=Yersinia rochesterensis TaxID=1604335 RepID=UPI00338FD512
QEEYYPFGGTAVFASRNTVEAKYKTVRYSGKERDATGLYYYGLRYYLPWLGRWLSSDPAGTVDGLNLYRMVRNNPILLMDEDGLMPILTKAEPEKNKSSKSFFSKALRSKSKSRQNLSDIDSAKHTDSHAKRESNDNSPKKGDLIYGVNTSFARKWYTDYNKKFKSIVVTIDEYKILKLDPPSKLDKDNSFQSFLENHEKYKSALYAKGNNEDVRRKSKGGIEWGISNNKRVHFVLDDLDILSVIKKNYQGKNSDKGLSTDKHKNRSITGSELRWVYRNKNNPLVRDNVIFWAAGKEVAAPWSEDLERYAFNPTTGEETHLLDKKEEWMNYKPTRTYLSI